VHAAPAHVLESTAMTSFDELLAEGSEAPIQGWDFGWLIGRASEERPSWHYAELLATRYQEVGQAVDLQCGGGELLSRLPALPPLLAATEGWAPNLAIAARRLRPRGAHVVAAPGNQPALPFRDDSFDLVTSRHPTVTWWEEIARILRPGGSYLSQQVGPHSFGELTEYLMGPQPPGSARDPRLAREAAGDARLEVVDLRSERLRVVFYDIGAVVYFLRLVVWIVPDFSVARYRQRLQQLHEQIERDGSFLAHSTRFLIEARK
jgi:SAM-dependent methyltransferase